VPDVQEVFEMVTQRVRPEQGVLERQHRRQRRRARARRAAAIATAATIGFVVIGLAVHAATEAPATRPAHRPTTQAAEGLRILDMSSGTVTAIPNVPVDARDADVSSQGSHIAFVSHETGRDQIYVVRSDGSGLRRVTDMPMGASDPAWSPDGSQIAFSGVTSDAHTDIFVQNSDGSGLTRLTHDSVEDYHPSWSPDGTTIVFNSIPSFAEQVPSFEVRTVGVLDGTVETVTRWTPYPCLCGLQNVDITGFAAEWTGPDRVAFVRPKETSGQTLFALQLLTVDAGSGTGSSGEPRPLVTGPKGAEMSFAWSPDGSRVAVLESTESLAAYEDHPGRTTVSIVNAATGRAEGPALDGGHGGARITWLPSGDRLLISG
jgi:dipeptidyl aminopeptidase/acylaminoacyl peptidase